MKNLFLFLNICFCTSIHSQDFANKVPDNAPFAMCINGKNLNDKVAINTIQDYPWIQEFLEKELNFLSKDLNQTGIDMANKQYHYYINKDSVMSYVAILPLSNSALFEKMVQEKFGNDLKVKKQHAYNSTALSKKNHLAWNDNFAVMVYASYTKPNKTIYTDTEPYSDLASMDTTGVLADSIAIVDNVVLDVKTKADPEKKEKVQKEKITKNTKSKNTAHEPVITEPTEEEIYALEKANAELEETKRKLSELEVQKTDSIETLKISPIVDLIFKETFDSNTEKTAVVSAIFKNNNPKSDFFIYADLDLLTTELYSGFFGANSTLTGIYKNGVLNSNYHLNGYFEKGRIRLNQVITPKNEETEKSFQEIFDSKIDKNLLNYVGNNVLGYYSISMDTQAILNYEYKILKNTLNSVYQSFTKEANGNDADVLIDAIALVIDEKAIADLIPGNALFVLHDLKKVQRDFIKIDYDENYQQIETKGLKDEIQPDFTFLVNTRNELFVNKLLQLPLNKSKFTAIDYQMTNGYYTIHFGNDNLLEYLYIGLKNGVVMFTTSKLNIENLIQQTVMPLRADFKKSISKNNSAVWFDIQKIIETSKTEFEKGANSNYSNIFIKNAGEISAESKFKNGTILSDVFYTIKGEHSNSLQYFFDIINDFYNESKKEKISTE